jgi:hypothetical protein
MLASHLRVLSILLSIGGEPRLLDANISVRLVFLRKITNWGWGFGLLFLGLNLSIGSLYLFGIESNFQI